MTPSYTLALAASLWVTPGSAPCNLAGEACWTPALVPAHVIAERAAGEGKPGEICRGNIIANTGARNGVPFRVEYQVAAFADSECIATTEYSDGWHEAHICGNPVRVLSGPSVSAVVVSEYMRDGVGLPPGATRTWGGASAHVASPHIPPVYVATWPLPAPYEPGANPGTEPPMGGVPIVPLPASVWMLMAAVAMLGALAMGRRA